ncbi:GSU3473 family protein [Geomesophilobacter sediminis]|uniref:Uncharacterized protein n=1 Tax=Geomesophilobacter sediminis TaxID=2798584 RepID=A0A8J7M054_9BACT|nr:hypothetical protein [Geomesophilobacter sediminis]MBJ6723402.1 hypothetical protein [Geomesophilobacter sediminis]
MLIQVLYPDERYDYVKEFMLDELIESQKITRFKRRSGWVTLGVDPIRKPRRKDPSFAGPERRGTVR